ncbi:hypothetical protein EDC56_1245 [Sinobacterium caligoides]|uniref:Immunity MXAN-0049 protein domain-containing protein n=1 Tax=Sinobacterium caligoides TaxID=933926 RepID=A0A3N2E0T0_9GAMM|nr:hypothetical protein [Sinobacterium caligoides]ROS05696.1 hypothetical protein EDC56_1245 [Sinobacterium caligoides]
MTYVIENDFESYHSLTFDLSDLSSKMPSYSQRFRAKPRLDSWVAPKAFFYASDNYTGKEEVIPDITTWALGNLVLSPKAYLILKDIMAASGEFLPIIVGADTYYMFNTLFVIPETAIDLSLAVDVVNSGVHMGQENVIFDEEQLNGRCIFKSPTNKLTFSFVTEVFRSKYDESGLTGLSFKDLNL